MARRPLLPDDALEVLERLEGALGQHLDGPLAQVIASLTPARGGTDPDPRPRLLRDGTYPVPHGDWPPVPWPPF